MSASARRPPAPSGAPASPSDVRRARVYATVDAIPPGAAASYGQVAEEAGLPRRARFVGRCLSQLPSGTQLPWWRVVNAAGQISSRGDGSSSSEQRRRLAAEGVSFTGSGRVDWKKSRWAP